MTAEFVVAVHAAVYLYHNGAHRSSAEIAQNVCTNPARVRKILAKLERAGLVCARAGIRGGYEFCGGADTTLKQVLQALGERAVNPPWRSGDVDMVCEISSGMAEAMDGVFEDMERQCGEVLDRVTIRALNEQLTAGSSSSNS